MIPEFRVDARAASSEPSGRLLARCQERRTQRDGYFTQSIRGRGAARFGVGLDVGCGERARLIRLSLGSRLRYSK